MKEIVKAHAKLKQTPDDFIVEEIGEKWPCSITRPFPSNQKPIVDLDESISKDFITCEMEKFDIDHFHAIKEVSRILKKSVRAIGYAGSKDRLAHTSQRISIFQANLEDVRNFHHDRIYLKNFKWAKRKIKLGYLDANHFKITLRDIDKKEAIKVAQRLRTTDYFPNYFGSQRFGSIRGNNVLIGKLLLKKKFKEAVEEILWGDSPNEKEEIKKARNNLKENKNYKEALNYFPRYLQLERSFLIHLAKDPSDYIKAIQMGERKNILMYVNAVQSIIFNEILKQALSENIDFTKEGQRSIPLMGFRTNFSKGNLGNIEEEILAKNDLNLRDFNLIEIPYLRLKGSYRKALIFVKDINVDIEDDEVYTNSKKINLEFTLPSGAYATTYLNEFFDLHQD